MAPAHETVIRAVGMALASLSGAFEGKVRIADQNPPSSFRLVVEGTGKIGFVKGEGLLTLADAGEGSTEVKYEGDVQVGGTIAGAYIPTLIGSVIFIYNIDSNWQSLLEGVLLIFAVLLNVLVPYLLRRRDAA